MKDKIRKISDYLRKKELVVAANKLTNKSFYDNGHVTQYVNRICGKSLKSDDWSVIITILNN